ncbi:heat shock protein, Hsp20 family [Glomus cerebriforme]|uniref:Heat shock protein, Hsp20 family n=1 Tax=Glomus cerebriforme TaxID=658196 RepID=A0A397SBC3_9GLOM|nr:heat shock protein, Hsp20 family [Glomus cerebriforme]
MSIIYGWNNNDFNQLERSVNRLFDDFMKDLNVARRSGVSSRGQSEDVRRFWSPLIDVHETDKEFTVNAELPGITKEQINVDVHDNSLVISGENKQEQKYKEGNTHIQERRFGSFTRSIPLPRNVKVEDISAKFNQGVLEVTLPKSEQIGKKITIS